MKALFIQTCVKEVSRKLFYLIETHVIDTDKIIVLDEYSNYFVNVSVTLENRSLILLD